jgi:hypothetical protein
LHLSKSEHCSLSSSEWKVAILGSIVEPAAHLPAIEIAQFTHGCRVGFQTIGDDRIGFAVALQRLLQEAQSRSFVSFPGDVALEYLTFVVDSAPQVMALAIDLYEHLVDVPPPLPEALHSAYPLTPNVSRKQRTEPVPPQTHGFVANVDSALKQQVLDVAQAQRKPDVHHHD